MYPEKTLNLNLKSFFDTKKKRNFLCKEGVLV